MGPLSRSEVEQICETVYYQVVELFSRYDYADSDYQFQNYVEQDFKDWTYPRFNYRIQESDKSIVYKWQQKLRLEAKQWYAENVERPRENDRRERQRREQEEREIEEQREEQAQRERARRREIEAEEYRRREEEQRIREEEERQHREEEQRRREEEEAIARARRKEQNELNKQRLAEIQAQWKARSNPAQQTSDEPQTAVQVENATCPKCGGSVRKNAKFCASCGAKLSVTCSACGATLKPTSKFCSGCGAPVSNL